MEPIVQLNSNAKLSEHFLLGEFTKSGSHPNIYNVPTHEAIANLKHLCQWLEVIRYAAILLDYADESQQEFDELLVERNRFGAIWLHFAVRFRGNRHKVLYINA